MTSLPGDAAYRPRKLDTFLIPSITSSGFGENHLHIALTNPVESGNGIPHILLVSISSIRSGESGHDQTCILKSDDHPFIKHDSYVVYRRAVIMELRDLEEKLGNGIIVPKERAGAEVVERIIEGVQKSPATKNHIVEFLRQPTG